MSATTQSDGNKALAGSPGEPAPFGRYELLGLLAKGGMAEVYRARLVENAAPAPVEMPALKDELLAIKCMRPNLAREARFVDMFVREGKLAQLLQHDAIVRTYETGRNEGRYFISMEFIGGKDLTQVLRRCQELNQRLPIPHCVYIAMKMCEGLHYAHTLSGEDGRPLNVVNRDVSPSNVRLAWDGRVKLLDFGIAQAALKFTSEIGVLKGKFSYMSPEQIRGMPVDARTDVFSTGIVLHELLTREKLFRADSEFELMEKVRNADIMPPSKFNHRVTPALDAVIGRALARDVVERYSSAKDFGDALAGLLAGYRFNQSEMREFLTSLFADDYRRDQEEAVACLRRSRPTPVVAAVPAAPARESVPTTSVTDVEGGPTDPAAGSGRNSGFWSRLKNKLTK
jgi:serine/threonine protein kinase